MMRRFDFPYNRFKNRMSPVKNTAGQQKNIKLLKDYSKKLKLELKNFTSNDNLDFYFDISRHGRDICYVYKGWDDPGFRMGELIELDKSAPDFKGRFYEIFKICSGRLISIGLQEQKKESLTLVLDIGIYKIGFNAKVFKKAIEDLAYILTEIGPLLS